MAIQSYDFPQPILGSTAQGTQELIAYTNQVLQSSRISVTFWGERLVTLPNTPHGAFEANPSSYQIPLFDLARKVSQLSTESTFSRFIAQLTPAEDREISEEEKTSIRNTRDNIYSIVNTTRTLYSVSDEAARNANFLTRIFAAVREFFYNMTHTGLFNPVSYREMITNQEGQIDSYTWTWASYPMDSNKPIFSNGGLEAFMNRPVTA